MKFGAHGSFNIWVEGNIAFFEVSGAWNLETAFAYIHHLNTVTSSQVTAPFTAIGILHDDWFPTADALPYLFKATEFAISVGLRKEAYVSQSALSAGVAERLVLPENSDLYQKQVFDNLEDAIKWVKQ